MDNANELKEALDFLSPSALTYDEWILVGMGLKEAGLPVEAWEQWSARDGGRYHKGECAKKWASFHGGGGSPVTASSIFQLAYSSGWRGPAGHALDWNDDISAGTNHTDGQLVDPRWVEAHDLALPEQWDPADQLKRYLRALFEADEYVAYVTESFMADDRRRPTRGCWDRTAGQLIAELDQCGGDLGKVVGDCDPEVGAWICFNPVDGTGRKDANITAYRYALVECDNMELGKQQAIIKQLELPCAALVYSGGKSVHAIVKVDAPDYTEYRKLDTAEKKLTELIASGKQELVYIDSVFDAVSRTDSEADLAEIRRELREQGYLKGGVRADEKVKKTSEPLHFRSTEGFEILVGRNNRQNDQLTLKTAKATDIWLHTQGIAGSHVIIRTEGRQPGEQTLFEAAQLAAFHSKGRSGSGVPVDYAAVKFVKKPAGAKPGMVIFTNNRTLYVTPDESLVNSLKAK